MFRALTALSVSALLAAAGHAALAANGCYTKFKSTEVATLDAPVAIETGDFNGDGNLDFAVVESGADLVSILLGNGDGTFQPQKDYTTANTPLALAVGDVNGDGILDLVTGSEYGRVSVLLGNGDGTFQAKQDYTTAGSDYLYGVALGDFNGDHMLDIAVAELGPGTVGVLLNNGDGTFGAAKTYNTAGAYSVAAADFNGDGKTDLAVTGGYHSVSVLLGKGDGTFGTYTSYHTGMYFPDAVVAQDLNGDNKIDLVVANQGQSRKGLGGVSVLLGKGDGSFKKYGVYPLTLGINAIAVGKITGDRYPDLVVTNGAGGGYTLPGNGDGTFGNAGYFDAKGYTDGVAIGAFRGQKPTKDDVVVISAGYGSEDVLFLRNEGCR